MIKLIMSYLFTIDARIKLICVLMLAALVFFIESLAAAVCMLIIFIIVRLTSGVFFRAGDFFKILTMLAVIIILIQTLFGPGTHYIIKPLIPHSFPVLGGMGSLKWEGFFLGLAITCRISALLLILPVFTETTPPHLIAPALCSLKLNYRVSFIITSTFNLVSIFKEEALSIMEAQKLRGMRAFEKHSFSFGMKAYIGLLVPLMLAAMRKAQHSSIAMDSRAFGIYDTRTWLDKPQLKKRDFCILFASIVLFFLILIINFHF